MLQALFPRKRSQNQFRKLGHKKFKVDLCDPGEEAQRVVELS